MIWGEEGSSFAGIVARCLSPPTRPLGLSLHLFIWRLATLGWCSTNVASHLRRRGKAAQLPNTSHEADGGRWRRLADKVRVRMGAESSVRRPGWRGFQTPRPERTGASWLASCTGASHPFLACASRRGDKSLLSGLVPTPVFVRDFSRKKICAVTVRGAAWEGERPRQLVSR